MNKLFLSLSVILLLQVGCEKIDWTTDFQIVATADGKVYRLNSESGEVFEIVNGRLMKILEGARTKLVIGEIYETENGKYLSYAGLGKFKEMLQRETIDMSHLSDEELDAIIQEIFKEEEK